MPQTRKCLGLFLLKLDHGNVENDGRISFFVKMVTDSISVVVGRGEIRLQEKQYLYNICIWQQKPSILLLMNVYLKKLIQSSKKKWLVVVSIFVDWHCLTYLVGRRYNLFSIAEIKEESH